MALRLRFASARIASSTPPAKSRPPSGLPRCAQDDLAADVLRLPQCSLAAEPLRQRSAKADGVHPLFGGGLSCGLSALQRLCAGEVCHLGCHARMCAIRGTLVSPVRAHCRLRS